MQLELLVCGAPVGGALPGGRPPAPGPPAPSSAPPWGLRAGLLRFAARSSLPACRRVGRPLLRRPGFRRGPLSAARAARRPVSRPLAVVVGGWFGPPLRPSWSGARFGLPGRRAPPRGPPLVVPGGSVPGLLPARRRSGALAPPPGGPSLLAPAPVPRGPAATPPIQPPPCQEIGHCVDRRNGAALMIQRFADPLDVPVFFHELNRINLPRRVGANVLRQAEGPRSPLDVLPDRLPCLMAPPG